ncbi:hypothetical protein L873DRAFT_1785574 [Choiromyces venosus 120613-1]|uniref:LIM zinc-binding domain-containing protein n=1 Tax=Choiromyces venosus 120613-1 TaxID=1336337 RepID=A0A3N4K447_9PEZI|nr:hypothetical protein L873DRAFT_1785574 [Choiromyces venosus 120613-1]
MADQARVSYMTKEQLGILYLFLFLLLQTYDLRMAQLTPVSLESYLSDLRSNRPQRPSGARPLSSAAKTRWAPQSSNDPSETTSEPSTYSSPSRFTPPRKVNTSPAKSLNEMSRREGWLLRKNSHKRSNTISTPSTTPLRTIAPIPTSSDKGKGWDGVSLQDGRMGDVPIPHVPTLTRSNSEKKRDSFSFRDFSKFGNGHGRSNSGSSTASTGSSNGATITRKKSVTWALPTLSRPSSPPPVVMPPTHPPPRSATPQIEEELTSHFRSLPTAPLPAVAPLRINKTSISGRSTTSSIGGKSSSVEPMQKGLPVVPEIAPGLKEFAGIQGARREFVEPHMREPTQNNSPRYTTNPVPLPSPPMSGSEEEDVDAAEVEALKELGRRPLPRVGTGQTTGAVRRNNQKYGAQIQPPPPPVVGIVISDDSPPSTASSSTSTITKAPSISAIRAPEDNSRPPVPIISFPDDDEVKKDAKPAPPVPSIWLPDDPPSSASTKPPTPTPSASRRPLPTPRASPKPPSSNYSSASSAGRGPTASCAYCRTPIEGRVVSASSLRFHPECFRCDHCHTRLEHVGFFPEPEESRRKRAEALQDDKSSISSGSTAAAHRVKFYCHLDFHELYSPRCRSCKTPIEGEVVMACGGTWHVGHFFCAECGDPFNPSSKFVEKDGYAWCVGCYQKRYNGRCKKCRQPITETVVKALGAEWHEACFCCTECSAKFDDGRFFIRSDKGKEVPVCVSCEERRLKA